MIMTLAQAENHESTRDTVWWEGWDLLVWTPGRGAGVVYNAKSVHNPRYKGRNKWGSVKRVSPNSDGLYSL